MIHENISKFVYIEHLNEDCGIQNIKLTMLELYENFLLMLIEKENSSLKLKSDFLCLYKAVLVFLYNFLIYLIKQW